MSHSKRFIVDLNDPAQRTFKCKGITISLSDPCKADPKTSDAQLLVEMWKSKDGKWEKLSKAQRRDILGKIGTGVAKLEEKGLKSLGFFVNDPKEGKHREKWTFVAVWWLPSGELLDTMLPQVDELPNWFEVMDESRVWGKIQTPADGAAILENWGDDED